MTQLDGSVEAVLVPLRPERPRTQPELQRRMASEWERPFISARPEELYEAFIDPTALVAWLPPAEMAGEIHEFDSRVGGGYRMCVAVLPAERTLVPRQDVRQGGYGQR